MLKVENGTIKPEYWIKAWEEARERSVSKKKMIRSSTEMVEYWNHFAPKYDQVHSPVKQNPRVQKVIEILQAEEFLTPDTALLDIGCGPGNYSLPLAEICRSVTALDGAAGMCQQLQKKVGQLGIDNIEVMHRLWEEIDLEKEQMVNKYDLVFASMTEAVSDYPTLEAMNRASRDKCCLIFWADNGKNRARSELWELIFKEADPGYGMASVIYPFNLLYSLGYFPSMRFIDSEWSNEEPVEEAVDSLARLFWLYIDISPEIKDIISRYVKENAIDGVFKRKTEACLGVVTWKTFKEKE